MLNPILFSAASHDTTVLTCFRLTHKMMELNVHVAEIAAEIINRTIKTDVKEEDVISKQ